MALEIVEKKKRIKKAKKIQKELEDLLNEIFIALMTGEFFSDAVGNSREDEFIERISGVLRNNSEIQDEITEKHISESAKEIQKSTSRRIIAQIEREVDKISDSSPVVLFIDNEYLSGYVTYDDESTRLRLQKKVFQNESLYPGWVVAILLGVALSKTDIPETIKNIFSKERSILIAENEANWIRNYSQHIDRVANGNVTHTWLSMQDEKVRPFHLEADGQTVPIDEPFEVGGELLMFPGDTSLGASPQNVIRCRCVEI